MFKKLLPYIVAVLTFAALAIAYFFPYYQDMTLKQGDVTQWEGMSKEIVDWNEQHPGDPALWTDGMFGGMPAVQISMIFPGNFVTKVSHVMGTVFPGGTMVLFLMLLGFFILLLCFDVNPWVALAGSLAYGLTSFVFISIEAGHNTKVQAISLMAPVLGGVVLAYRKNLWVGGALTAFFLALAIDSGHLQIIYYLMMMVGVLVVYLFVESIMQKKLPGFFKASAVLVLAAGLAVLPNIANLWSTQEYGKETIRGGGSELTQKKEASKGGGLDFDYASRWSYGLTDGEFMTVAIPNMSGGGSGVDREKIQEYYTQAVQKGLNQNYAQQVFTSGLVSNYWGDQPFTSGPVYFGAIVFFLFIFALLVVNSPIKWPLIILTLLSFLLAFGHNTPVFGWFFNALPFFNKFRTPSMALVIAELTMPLLAILGLNEVLKGRLTEKQLFVKLLIAGGITAALLILFGFLGSALFSFTSPNDKQLIEIGGKINFSFKWLVDQLKEDRAALAQADALRSLIFVVLAFGALWLLVKKKVPATVGIGILAVLFLADSWTVSKRFLNNENFVEAGEQQSAHTPTQADLNILAAEGAVNPQTGLPSYRVFNKTRDPFNDAMTSYFHKSVGGYHAAKLIRYQDLIENQISKNNPGVFNMLNTKYFIEQGSNGQPVAVPNAGALGNAWLVQNIKWVKNADEEMAALNDFNPKETVVIDEDYKAIAGNVTPSPDPSAGIKLTYYSPNVLKYAYSAASPQVAVFSEIYYNNKKGWNAYVDGKYVEHFRANYVLRGLTLPAGSHTVEFKFEPGSIVTGNKIAYAGSFLLFAFVFGIFGYLGYKKYKEIKDAGPVVPAAKQQPVKTKPVKRK